MNTNKHNGHVINEMTTEQVANWLGAAVQYQIVCDAPDNTWGDVMRVYADLTGLNSLTLIRNAKESKAPCYLIVANDEYITEAVLIAESKDEKESEYDYPILLINDESGYGAIFSAFHADERRTLLGVFGDVEEAQELIDEWNGED